MNQSLDSDEIWKLVCVLQMYLSLTLSTQMLKLISYLKQSHQPWGRKIVCVFGGRFKLTSDTNFQYWSNQFSPHLHLLHQCPWGTFRSGWKVRKESSQGARQKSRPEARKTSIVQAVSAWTNSLYRLACSGKLLASVGRWCIERCFKL